MSQCLVVIINSRYQNSKIHCVNESKQIKMSGAVQKKKRKMKIFQTVQKQLSLVGFAPDQQQNTNRTFSKIQLWGIITSLTCTSLVVVYIFHVANRTEDYMYSIFSLTTSIGITASEISMTYANDKIYNAIDSGEELLAEAREFRIVFRKVLTYFASNRVQYY